LVPDAKGVIVCTVHARLLRHLAGCTSMVRWMHGMSYARCAAQLGELDDYSRSRRAQYVAHVLMYYVARDSDRVWIPLDTAGERCLPRVKSQSFSLPHLNKPRQRHNREEFIYQSCGSDARCPTPIFKKSELATLHFSLHLSYSTHLALMNLHEIQRRAEPPLEETVVSSWVARNVLPCIQLTAEFG
jgi:hypothetical protein